MGLLVARWRPGIGRARATTWMLLTAIMIMERMKVIWGRRAVLGVAAAALEAGRRREPRFQGSRAAGLRRARLEEDPDREGGGCADKSLDLQQLLLLLPRFARLAFLLRPRGCL